MNNSSVCDFFYFEVFSLKKPQISRNRIKCDCKIYVFKEEKLSGKNGAYEGSLFRSLFRVSAFHYILPVKIVTLHHNGGSLDNIMELH